MEQGPFIEWLRTRKGVASVLLFIGLVSVGLYLPSLRYDFVLNDRQLIINNRLLANSSPAELFTRGFWAGTSTDLRPTREAGAVAAYYRPITTLSFWLDLKIGGRIDPHGSGRPDSGGKAWLFHLVNVLLGAGAAMVVTLIVWELLHSGVWAGLAGLVFATHPTHAESIGSIYGRGDLLLTLFAGFGAFALLRSLRKRDWRWWWAVPFCFAFALLSKESAFLFPILVAITPLLAQSRVPKRFGVLVLVLLAIALVYLWVRTLVFNQALPLPTRTYLEPAERLGVVQFANITNTFGYYLRIFFWPFGHRVHFPSDPAFLKPTPLLIYTIVFFVSLPLAGFRPRFRIVLWGYVWTILFLLPVSNIIPLGLQAAERLLFFPSVGLVAIVIPLLSRMLVAHHQIRAMVGILLLLIAAVFAWDTSRRLPVWRNELSLFSAMVKEAPQEPGGYAGLARTIQEVMPDSAIKLYNRAILLDQGYIEAHINIATLYSQKGDYRRAVHHLRLADELRPDLPEIQAKLGFAFLAGAIQKLPLLDSVRAAFSRALLLDTTLLQALLGTALTLGLEGKTEEAGVIFARLKKEFPDWLDSARVRIWQLAPRDSFPEKTIYHQRLEKLLLLIGTDQTRSLP